MGASGPDRDGAHPRGLEVGLMPASRRLDDERAAGEASGRPAAPTTPSVLMPARAEGRPEEMAVCELCGLVSRLPRPLVCPACGGGYG